MAILKKQTSKSSTPIRITLNASKQDRLRLEMWVRSIKQLHTHNCIQCIWNSLLTRVHRVVKVPPLVHPDLCNPGRILIDDLSDSARERIRRFVPEYMAHVRTGRNLEKAATLPNLDDLRHETKSITTSRVTGIDRATDMGHTVKRTNPIPNTHLTIQSVLSTQQ